MQDKKNRPYDVIVWGATGFTGKLVAEYFTQHYGVGGDVKWALAGRSKDKLERLRNDLKTIDPKAADLPIILGDAREPKSLAVFVPQTRVILTTVGPYSLFGHELVAACAEHGTDYCDLTGEVPFMRDSIDANHARAIQTGARIVHTCGFDSIPSDLGVLMLQNRAQEMKTRCSRIRYFVMKTKGGASGGTIASILNLVESATHDPRVRKISGNPYALVSNDKDQKSERGPDGRDQMGVRYDADLGRWTAPFLMAAVNTRVVRRSNALLGYPWGKDFRYSEATSTGRGPKGWVKAAAVSAGTGVFFAALAMKPVRKLLAERVLPKAGEGPSKAVRDSGFFTIKLLGDCESGKKLEAIVSGTSDPGYGETAKMITESAICLAKDDLGDRAGVLTPASCMGMTLVHRLQRAGMTFEVRDA